VLEILSLDLSDSKTVTRRHRVHQQAVGGLDKQHSLFDLPRPPRRRADQTSDRRQGYCNDGNDNQLFYEREPGIAA
jgi:hypothetical protein